MTTAVKIDAHAGWPVRVVEQYANHERAVRVVKPGTEETVYVHSGLSLRVSEVQPGERAHTFGEKAVGLSFNPSSSDVVAHIKELYAEIIDVCDRLRGTATTTGEGRRLFSVAITEAQTAQMWAVKAATWKD